MIFFRKIIRGEYDAAQLALYWLWGRISLALIQVILLQVTLFSPAIFLPVQFIPPLLMLIWDVIVILGFNRQEPAQKGWAWTVTCIAVVQTAAFIFKFIVFFKYAS